MWGPPSSTASPRSRSWRAKGGTAPGPAPGGPNRRTCSLKSRSTSSRTTPSKCLGFPKTMPQTGAPNRDPRCLYPTGVEKPPGCPRRSPHRPSPLSSQVLGVGGAVLRRPHQRGGPSPGGAAQAARGRGRALQGEELQVPFPTPFIPHPLSCPLSSIISLARSRTAPKEPLLILTTPSAPLPSGWRGREPRAERAPRLSPQIPPLGKHYSQRWAQEDLLEEQKDGARAAAAADKKKGVLGPLTELDTKGAFIPAWHNGLGAAGRDVGGWHPASAEPELPPPRC